MLSSIGSVTVPSSNSSNPFSEDEVWPEDSNKVAITVRCPNHHVKFILQKPGVPDQGNVILRGENGSISVFCKDAGDKDYYEGEIKTYPVNRTGPWPCRGNVGSTDTLIVEWTQEGLKLMRDEKIILSRTWGSTDGHCRKKPVSWRIQNWGSTVILAESVVGT